MSVRGALALTIPLGACLLFAQTDDEQLLLELTNESKPQIENYLVREARQQTNKARQELAGKTAWEPLRAQCRGEMLDMLGLDAALFDEHIQQVILKDPPASHRLGPYFLNVLCYTDLPEAAALLAPRRLTFYAHLPEAYAPTRKIYELYPEKNRFGLSMGARQICGDLRTLPNCRSGTPKSASVLWSERYRLPGK